MVLTVSGDRREQQEVDEERGGQQGHSEQRNRRSGQKRATRVLMLTLVGGGARRVLLIFAVRRRLAGHVFVRATCLKQRAPHQTKRNSIISPLPLFGRVCAGYCFIKRFYLLSPPLMLKHKQQNTR